MKRVLLITLVLAAMTGIVFTGCAKKSTELVINSYMSDQVLKDEFQRTVDVFKAENPKLTVTVNTIAHEQYKTLLPSWLTSQQAPDIVTWFAGYRMQAFAEKGLLEPLTNDVFPGGSFEKEFPASFKSASSYKDSIYFLPQSWYWWAMYYNKDVFAKYNITPPKTWDEFLVVCETLRKNGVAPVAMGAKDTWTAGGWFDYMDSAVNGGEFHVQLTKGDIPYTDPRVVKTFKTLTNLAEKKYIQDNASSYSWQEAATLMFDGKAGMYLIGQFVGDVAPADKKASIGWFRFPTFGTITDYSVDTPTDGFMIPKNAKNKENAKKFITFLATAKSQEAFCKPLGRLAANINVAPPSPDAELGLAMIKGAKSAMQFYDRDAPEEMAAKGMNAIMDAMADPAKLDEILANLDKERIRIYEK